MGCSASREKLEGTDLPLDYQMEHTGVDTIDEMFNKSIEIIKTLEGIREIVIDKKENLFLLTGACCHTKPDLFQCLRGFIWRLSTEHEGDLTKAKVDILEEEPFIKLDATYNTEVILNIRANLVEYMKEVNELLPQTQAMKSQLEDIGQEVMEASSKFLQLIGDAYNKQILAVPGVVKKAQRNKERVLKAMEIAVRIVEEIENSKEQFKIFFVLNQNQDDIAKINTVGANSHKFKYKKTSIDIVWNNLPQIEKLGNSPKEGYNLYKRKIESKKEKRKRKLSYQNQV